MYYRMYLLRSNGVIDEFTSPTSMDNVKKMAVTHSVPYAVLETIKADDREVCIAREM